VLDVGRSLSCLAATESEFGFVRDSFALKPLSFAESDCVVTIATEIGTPSGIEGEYEFRETQAKKSEYGRDRCG
jgi:hypothetical protein